MASILNAFSSTTRFSARSQTGEAIMNNGTNGSVSPNADTTLGVAQHATVRSKEGWLGAQYSVTLDNNINVKQFNLTTGDSGTDRSFNPANNIRQIKDFFVPQDNATRNGANFDSHPVWSGIVLFKSINGRNGEYIVNDSLISDPPSVLSPGSAGFNSSFISNTSLSTNNVNGVIISLGGGRTFEQNYTM